MTIAVGMSGNLQCHSLQGIKGEIKGVKIVFFETSNFFGHTLCKHVFEDCTHSKCVSIVAHTLYYLVLQL